MNESYIDELDELRLKIDAVDCELLKVLNQRAELVIKVGIIKQKKQLEILDSHRENKLMRQLLKSNQGPLSNGMVDSLFHSIIEILKQLQSNNCRD